MASEGGFLSRWSRRKQEAARPAPPVPPAPTAAELAAAREAQAALAAEAAAREAAAREAEAREREEVLSRLPRIEDLLPDSDFRPFMHPLVPQALRSAALARLWLLDPGIRGYVDPALDYAHDFNVPGGIPGGGPPPSAEEVETTLRQVFARFDSEERVDPPAGAPEAPADAGAGMAQAGEGEGAAGMPPGRDGDGDGSTKGGAGPVAEAAAETPEATADAAQGLPGAGEAQDPRPGMMAQAPPAAPIALRRHGGAMPS